MTRKGELRHRASWFMPRVTRGTAGFGDGRPVKVRSVVTCCRWSTWSWTFRSDNVGSTAPYWSPTGETERLVDMRSPPSGAGFVAPTDFFLRGDGLRRPVSITPLNDGRMVVSVCYMQGNEGSPVRQTDLLLISPKAPATSEDLSKSDLVGLLDQSWTVRYKAHQEILRRRGPILKQAAERFPERHRWTAD